VLHVGSTISRKRIDVLLRVFARVSREFPDFRLVRVGGGFTAEQSQIAEDLNLDGKIVQTPRLTTAQVGAVYRKAALLLQTSGAEGFGLPSRGRPGCLGRHGDSPAARTRKGSF
jgi:glycosyltransferase involved in cell wall biosynthesis